MSKVALLAAFSARAVVTLRDGRGGWVTGRLSSIEHEDGSGSSFNVTLLTDAGRRTVYLRVVG